MLAVNGIIIDVRSKHEFYSGNISKSINIPLHELSSNLIYLNDKKQPIIICCASGIRSVIASKILLVKGYTNVVNGGAWSTLEKKLNN